MVIICPIIPYIPIIHMLSFLIDIHVVGFFLLFKVLTTMTGAMKVNTLQLLLLFSYHPADPGPEPALVK